MYIFAVAAKRKKREAETQKKRAAPRAEKTQSLRSRHSWRKRRQGEWETHAARTVRKGGGYLGERGIEGHPRVA